MRLVTLALVASSAGCNQVYGLEATQALDAFHLPDRDGDGTPDSVDNCIDLANDQADADEDGFGDTCDNCPLVANRLQEHEGDSDPVGDACNPNPRVPGDYLIELDVLHDPAAFSARPAS